MKIKNLSFFEKHVEKIILGVAGCFFIIVSGVYFVAQPYTCAVKVGAQTETVGPDKVEAKVLEQAQRLERKLNDSTSPLPPIQIPQYVKNFTERYQTPALAAAELPVPLGAPGLSPDIITSEESGVAGPRYAIPDRPTPESIKARADHAVLVENNADSRMGALLKLVNPETPHDFFYVSISGDYDIQAWTQKLHAGSTPRIPEDWWRGYLLITYAQLERQRLDPDTKQWGESTFVAPLLPEDLQFSQPPATFNIQAAQEALNRIRANQEQITQPAFPQITNDRPWLPPELDISKLSSDLVQKLADVLHRINELQKQIDQQKNIPSPTPAMPGLNIYPPGMPVPPGDMGRGNPTEQSAGPASEMSDLLRQRELLLDGRDPAKVPPIAFHTKERDRHPESPAKTHVLAHDLTVQPGQTYRYRLIVGVYNPIFHRKQVETQQQKEFYDRLSLASPASAWSDPVTVEPRRRSYLIGSSTDLQTATWEVWRIFNGRWVFHEFIARSGDVIGGNADVTISAEKKTLAMNTGTVQVDLDVSDTTLGTTTRAVLMNLNTGSLFVRLLAQDRDDTIRSQLHKDWEWFNAPKTPLPKATDAPPVPAPTPVRQPRKPSMPPPELFPPGPGPGRFPGPGPGGR